MRTTTRSLTQKDCDRGWSTYYGMTSFTAICSRCNKAMTFDGPVRDDERVRNWTVNDEGTVCDECQEKAVLEALEETARKSFLYPVYGSLLPHSINAVKATGQEVGESAVEYFAILLSDEDAKRACLQSPRTSARGPALMFALMVIVRGLTARNRLESGPLTHRPTTISLLHGRR